MLCCHLICYMHRVCSSLEKPLIFDCVLITNLPCLLGDPYTIGINCYINDIFIVHYIIVMIILLCGYVVVIFGTIIMMAVYMFIIFQTFQLPKVGARFGITSGLLLMGGAELLFG